MNPTDSTSPLEGLGRFNIENFLLYKAGLPLQSFTPSQLTSCRWFADSLLPFLFLICFSYLPLQSHAKREAQQKRTRQFFAKLRTPIGLTPEDDAREVALSLQNPHRFDHLKIFPNSSWELYQWSRTDALGFALCWLVVALILTLLFTLLHRY